MPLEHLNLWLFGLLAAPPQPSAAQLLLATVLAEDLIYLLPLLLTAMWLWGSAASRLLALRALLATLLALAGNTLLASLWQHPRPFMLGLAPNWLHHAADSSFPSDHMTVCAAVAFALLAGGRRRLGAACLLLALLVAAARVYLGVHFPLDMLGAMLMAALANALLASAWPRLSACVLPPLQGCYRYVCRLPIRRGWCRP